MPKARPSWRFRGRLLPMIDRVEISIVEVQQPRWLAFLNEQFDLLAWCPPLVSRSMPNGALAPNLAKRGVKPPRATCPTVLFTSTWRIRWSAATRPEKVALRRAISLATQTEREIVTVWPRRAVSRASVVAPGTWGYDPAAKAKNSDGDLPRAKALLDLYGYVDRDGDGWREQPDGAPLLLRFSTPDELSRQFDDLWKKNMDALGLRLVIDTASGPRTVKMAARRAS